MLCIVKEAVVSCTLYQWRRRWRCSRIPLANFLRQNLGKIWVLVKFGPISEKLS